MLSRLRGQRFKFQATRVPLCTFVPFVVRAFDVLIYEHMRRTRVNSAHTP